MSQEHFSPKKKDAYPPWELTPTDRARLEDFFDRAVELKMLNPVTAGLEMQKVIDSYKEAREDASKKGEPIPVAEEWAEDYLQELLKNLKKKFSQHTK